MRNISYIEYKGLRLTCDANSFMDLYQKEVLDNVNSYLDWFDALNGIEYSLDKLTFITIDKKKNICEWKDITQGDINKFKKYLFKQIDAIDNDEVAKALKKVVDFKLDYFLFNRDYWRNF
ncbi:hypothetical protein [Mycoplasma sp. VS30B]